MCCYICTRARIHGYYIYIYMYIYTLYIYTYIYIHTHTYIYIYVDIHIYTHTHVSELQNYVLLVSHCCVCVCLSRCGCIPVSLKMPSNSQHKSQQLLKLPEGIHPLAMICLYNDVYHGSIAGKNKSINEAAMLES